MSESEELIPSLIERVAVLEREVEMIKKRNTYVESRKSWEISKTRLISLTILTYVTMILIFFALGSGKPFLDACVPTTGFFLSTLSLSFIKRVWERGGL